MSALPDGRIERVLTALITALLPERTAQPLLSDLQEGFRIREQRGSLRQARRWLRAQLLRTLRPDRLAALRRVETARGVDSGRWSDPARRLIAGGLADLRHAARTLRLRPGFALLTVLVLAGGLAVSIFTFSFLNTVLHRPLPLPDGDSVVRLMAVEEGRTRLLDAADFERLREGLESFDVLGAYETRHVLVRGTGETRPIYATVIEPNMHEVARVAPAMGRRLLPTDAAPGAEPVVLLGDRVWRTTFGAEPGVVGRFVDLNGVRTRIVGVMPASFGFPVFGQLWLPLERPVTVPERGERYLNVYGRLPAGADRDRAETELATGLERLRTAEPDPNVRYPDSAVIRTFQRAQLGDEADLVFFSLHLAAGFILLLCCVNAANLLLARGLEREREIRVRLALGAPRSRLVVQMMTEGALITLLAGGLAVWLVERALAIFDSRARAAMPEGLAYWWRWGIDAPTLWAAATLVGGTLLLVGGLPAWSVTRRDRGHALREDHRPGSAGGSARLSRAVVVLQISVIAVLLFMGGVTSMVARRAGDIDLGLRTERVMFGNVELPEDTYGDARSRIAFLQRLEGELVGRPAVAAAVFRASMGDGTPFEVEGVSYETEEQRPEAQVRVSMGEQSAIGIELLAGRRLDARDTVDSVAVALVSESLARRLWGEVSPLGRRIRLAQEAGEEDPGSREVVGVVSDILEGNPIGRNRDHDTIYLPMSQVTPARFAVTFRHRGDVRAGVTALHEALAAVDPEVRPDRVEDFDAMLQTMQGMSRAATGVIVGCFGFALLLAIGGIYGLTARSVLLRIPEVGVRRALGATDRQVLALLLGSGLRQLMLGLGAATLVAALLGTAVSRFVALDPLVWISAGLGVPTIIGCIVLLATWLPSRRAVMLSPREAIWRE